MYNAHRTTSECTPTSQDVIGGGGGGGGVSEKTNVKTSDTGEI